MRTIRETEGNETEKLEVRKIMDEFIWKINIGGRWRGVVASLI